MSIVKKVKMARGYMEMGAINLAISQADFKYENEAMIKLGEIYNEMDSKNTKGDAKRN